MSPVRLDWTHFCSHIQKYNKNKFVGMRFSRSPSFYQTISYGRLHSFCSVLMSINILITTTALYFVTNRPIGTCHQFVGVRVLFFFQTCITLTPLSLTGSFVSHRLRSTQPFQYFSSIDRCNMSIRKDME